MACYDEIVGIAGTHGKLVEANGHVVQLGLRAVEACANHPAAGAALLYIALAESGREREPTIVEGIVEVEVERILRNLSLVYVYAFSVSSLISVICL